MSHQTTDHQSITPTAQSLGIFDDAPTPWRIANAYSEVVAILDARGRTLFICRAELSGRIIGSVNMIECAYQKEAKGR